MKTLSMAIVTFAAWGSMALADRIIVSVDIKSDRGLVQVALFNSQENFDKSNTSYGVRQKAQKGIMEIVLDGVAPGTYGIAMYHDENENNQLDKNFLGAPKEPYGFSRNPTILFSAPKFDAFKFDFKGKPLKATISLNGN